MDQELKQRLIGAAIITALAAIFLPMMFDDPIDQSGQTVSELVIPDPPSEEFEATSSRIADVGDEVYQSDENFQAEEMELEPAIDNLIEEKSFEPEPVVEEPVHEVITANKTEADKIKIAITDPVQSEKSPADNNPTGGWLIQMGSFSRKDNAYELRNNLIDQGYPASIDDVRIKGNLSYRLIVGPVFSKSKAASMQAKLDKTYKTKSILLAPSSGSNNSSQTTNIAWVRWYIQLGTFSNKENAYKLRDDLRKQGFPASIEESKSLTNKTYKLVVGPELSKEKAQIMQSQLAKQNKLKSILITE